MGHAYINRNTAIAPVQFKDSTYLFFPIFPANLDGISPVTAQHQPQNRSECTWNHCGYAREVPWSENMR